MKNWEKDYWKIRNGLFLKYYATTFVDLSPIDKAMRKFIKSLLSNELKEILGTGMYFEAHNITEDLTKMSGIEKETTKLIEHNTMNLKINAFLENLRTKARSRGWDI